MSAKFSFFWLCHHKTIHFSELRVLKDPSDLQRKMVCNVVFLSYKIHITHVVARIFFREVAFSGSILILLRANFFTSHIFKCPRG